MKDLVCWHADPSDILTGCPQDENYESATPAYSDTLWVGKP
jgi:hypothetical protein